MGRGHFYGYSYESVMGVAGSDGKNGKKASLTPLFMATDRESLHPHKFNDLVVLDERGVAHYANFPPYFIQE